jgi:Tfp pilus assembly protein PilO
MNKRAPLIAAGVALVLVVLTYLFLVKPKMGDVSAAKATLTTKQEQGSTLQTLVATLRDDQANQSKFQSTIDMVDQRIPPLEDQQGLLALLQSAGTQAGVDHVSAQFGTPTVTSPSGVATIPVTVNIQGRYFTIAEFFSKIETLPRAAKVTQFTLSPGGSAVVGAAPPGTMLLSATIEFYTADTLAGLGSDPGSQPPASFNPSSAASASPAAPAPTGAP